MRYSYSFAVILLLASCRHESTLPPPEAPADIPPVPEELVAMDQAEPLHSIYVSADHACTDPARNDGSVPACDGNAGPFASLADLMASQPEIVPGTALVLRAGTYPLQTLSLPYEGTAQAPLFVLAYPGEQPVLDGGFHGPSDPFDPDRLLVYVSGSYIVVKGLTFDGCHRTCMLVTGQHVVVADNTFLAGQEDALKTSFGNQDVYITRNLFRFPSTQDLSPESTPEALDGFQATRVWVEGNEFRDSDVDLGGWGAVAWFKSGANEVYFYDNHVHDLRVTSAGVILGGCCFNNWDWQPDLPVARNVVFARNRIERVTFASSYRYRGAIMSEGCHGCAALDNQVLDCEAGLSIRSTSADGEPVPQDVLRSTAVSFLRNRVQLSSDAPLFAVEEGSELKIDENEYSCDQPRFILGGEELDAVGWQDAGYDQNSQICP